MSTDLRIKGSSFGDGLFSEAPKASSQMYEVAAKVTEILSHNGRRSASKSEEQLIEAEMEMMASGSRNFAKIFEDCQILVTNGISSETAALFAKLHGHFLIMSAKEVNYNGEKCWKYEFAGDKHQLRALGLL